MNKQEIPWEKIVDKEALSEYLRAVAKAIEAGRKKEEIVSTCGYCCLLGGGYGAAVATEGISEK